MSCFRHKTSVSQGVGNLSNPEALGFLTLKDNHMRSLNQYTQYVLAEWQSLSLPSKFLVGYGLLMLIGWVLTYTWSLHDSRLIRDVGVWVKPMKFMAATALFVLTCVWLLKLANSSIDELHVFNWIVILIVMTSLFEVVYISYQASQAEASHYNVSDSLHAFMFGLMAIAAIGLTASQAWMAWEIWKEQRHMVIPTTTWGVIIGLALTFVLSTVSGFMLGGNQPPAGQGLPIVGWHFYKDIRPAHFLGVHAQQLIPIGGLIAVKFLGSYATAGLVTGSLLYVLAWAIAAWSGL
jgi:hypothetical protein